MTDIALPAPARFDRRLATGSALSAGLHFGAIALLLLLSQVRPMSVPPPQPVTVEIVTPQQLAALAGPVPAPAPLTARAAPGAGGSDAAGAAPARSPGVPGLHVATEFYAGSILSEPSMRRMRATLGRFAPGERLVQLCNIEGLEQIRRGAPSYDPDTLVSYAMSDPLVAGLTLTAPGGAFRSRRKWYGVQFKCTVAADLESVTAFEFRLGAPIPPEQWEEHNLNAADEDE